MTWANVLSKLEFYDQFGTPQAWGANAPFGGLLAFANATEANNFEQDVTAYLEAMYINAPTGAAAAAMDAAVASGNLRIGQATSNDGAWYKAGDNIVGYNLVQMATIQYINDHGELVQGKIELSIIHEVMHAAGHSDIGGNYSDSVLNGATFDHQGAAVGEQNDVAVEMGWADLRQISYLAGGYGNDPRIQSLQVGFEYSGGNEIDIARFGDVPGYSTANVINHTTRSDGNVRDLIFGFGNSDEIRSGAGNDYVYGGDEDDDI